MKKKLIPILLALLPIAAFSQTILYIEFTGSGILHRGVIVLDESGSGVCLTTFQMNGSQQSVVQEASLSQLTSNYQAPKGYWDKWQKQNGYAKGWQTSPPQQQQPQGFTISCTNPRDLRTGQAASGYSRDNFTYQNNQFTVQSGSLSVTANVRQMAMKGLPNLLQQMGIQLPDSGALPRNDAQPPSSLPGSTQPKRQTGPGPKYPSGNNGGLGLGFNR